MHFAGSITGVGTIGGDVTNDGGTISPGLRLPGQSPVPEPAGLVLLVIGCALLSATLPRSRQNAI